MEDIVLDQRDILRRISELREEHRDLDAALSALVERAVQDQLQIARLKRRKLALKDHIALLEGQMIPDIIA